MTITVQQPPGVVTVRVAEGLPARVSVPVSPATVTVVARAERGEKGERGPAGASGGGYYHVQSIPAATWEIEHGLGFRPAVAVYDSAGNACEGGVAHPTPNRIVLTFSAAFAGTCRLV
jgi:hypothetical protein